MDIRVNMYPMTLDGRDRTIVQLVARFKQMSSAQIHELVFSNLASHTPCDRALRRLVEDQYLARIERRMVGGPKGGSGQYVYQLGRRGFFTYFEGRYNPARAINYHSIAIVDSYLVIRRLQLAEAIKVRGFSTEPDCWSIFGNIELKPDLYADIERANGQRGEFWLEVDMATEGQKQLRGKLEAYWRCYGAADRASWPITVWVAVDQERERELRWLIGQLHENHRTLFAVCTKESLSKIIT